MNLFKIMDKNMLLYKTGGIGMINIGEKIKEYRTKNKLTQAELADKLYVSDKTVSSWESGRTEPDFNTLTDICKALNTNFFSLIGEEYNTNNVEIELKIAVDEKEQERILNLIKNDSKFVLEEDQEATYYNLSHRKMNNEWLRIRREKNNYVLNYKKKNNGIIEEYEVSVDNVDNLKTIFSNIDLKESVRVDKHRISYLYKNKYEFSFDNVKYLGRYVEIELKNQEYSNDEEIQKLIELVKKLSININSIETRRYPEIIISRNNS